MRDESLQPDMAFYMEEEHDVKLSSRRIPRHESLRQAFRKTKYMKDDGKDGLSVLSARRVSLIYNYLLEGKSESFN